MIGTEEVIHDGADAVMTGTDLSRLYGIASRA